MSHLSMPHPFESIDVLQIWNFIQEAIVGWFSVPTLMIEGDRVQERVLGANPEQPPWTSQFWSKLGWKGHTSVTVLTSL